MEMLPVALIAATLLCSLVTGFLFAFAVVIMPGIGRLDDGECIRAFQAVDRVIQDNQPLFMAVWVGSVLVLIAATAIGVPLLEGTPRVLLIVAVSLYIVGVQLPTGAVNVPLNNTLQTLDVDDMNDASRSAARAAFESRWNRWNAVRTAVSLVVSVLLLIVLPLTLAAQDRRTPAGTVDHEAAIRAAREAQNRAIAEADFDLVAGFWTEDVTIRSGLGFTLAGRDAYRAAFSSDSSVVYIRTPEDVRVSEEWPLGWEQGTWVGRHRDDGETLISGRYAAQWIEVDDEWKIRSELFVALECERSACAWPVIR